MPAPHLPLLAAMLLEVVLHAPLASAQTAERPLVKAGDVWRFVVYHGQRATTPNRIWRVREVSESEIEATENGEPLRLTPELNVLESPARRDSNTLQLQFPLAVGRQWRYVTDLLFKDNGSTARTSAEVRVLAHEKVQVVAGEFEAFRIFASGRIEGRSRGGPGVLAGTFESTYWYAPSVRAIVKATTTSTYRGTSHLELVDAALRP